MWNHIRRFFGSISSDAAAETRRPPKDAHPVAHVVRLSHDGAEDAPDELAWIDEQLNGPNARPFLEVMEAARKKFGPARVPTKRRARRLIEEDDFHQEEQDVEEIRARLAGALGTGEMVGIFYHGGSQSGAFREIQPIELLDIAVRARCHTSKSTKRFRLAQIEMADPYESEANLKEIWREPLIMPDAADVAEIEALYRERVEAAGWTVIITRNDYGEAFNLHSKFKNGKTRKTPDCALEFSVYRGEPLSKPWRFYGQAWKTAGPAIGAMLQRAGVA